MAPSTSASIFFSLPGTWRVLGGHLVCFFSPGPAPKLKGHSALSAVVVELVDESPLLTWACGTGPRQTAEGVINLALSYVLHHQPFGFRAKVAHPGVTGCVRSFVQRRPSVPHITLTYLAVPPASFSVSVQGSTMIQHTFYLMSVRVTFCQAAAAALLRHVLQLLLSTLFPLLYN